MAQKEEAGQPVETHPHAFKTTHTVRSGADYLSGDLPADIALPKRAGAGSIITEQDHEESEISVHNVNIAAADHQMFGKRELQEKAETINKYKRIDQMTLNRVGLKQK